MPLVTVRYKPEVSNDLLAVLGPALQIVVAEHLSCSDEGGELTEADIEVLFDEANRFDVGGYALTISLEAMVFPSRLHSFYERIEALRNDIRMMQPYSFGLWAKLCNAAWFEDPGEAVEIDGASA